MLAQNFRERIYFSRTKEEERLVSGAVKAAFNRDSAFLYEALPPEECSIRPEILTIALAAGIYESRTLGHFLPRDAFRTLVERGAQRYQTVRHPGWPVSGRYASNPFFTALDVFHKHGQFLDYLLPPAPEKILREGMDYLDRRRRKPRQGYARYKLVRTLYQP